MQMQLNDKLFFKGFNRGN